MFPSDVYDRLRSLLLQSINVDPITSSAVYILGEIVSSKMEAAQPLVRLLVHHGQLVTVMKALASHEISKLTYGFLRELFFDRDMMLLVC